MEWGGVLALVGVALGWGVNWLQQRSAADDRRKEWLRAQRVVIYGGVAEVMQQAHHASGWPRSPRDTKATLDKAVREMVRLTAQVHVLGSQATVNALRAVSRFHSKTADALDEEIRAEDATPPDEYVGYVNTPEREDELHRLEATLRQAMRDDLGVIGDRK